MPDMTWNQAVFKVFEDNKGREITIGDIAQEVLDKGYRTSVGKTPQNTVRAIITRSFLAQHGIQQPQRGRSSYILPTEETSSELDEEIGGLNHGADPPPSIKIEAYGLHWERNNVDWIGGRRILGYDSDPRETIDFANQQGVYVLYDWNSVVYVGQTVASDGGLFQRLQYHHQKQDWEAGWERFSWFGVRPVNENGEIIDGPDTASKRVVSELMEAVLIETLRPAFNRQLRGNNMGTLYRQAVDPIFTTR